MVEIWSLAPEILLARSGDVSRVGKARPLMQPNGTVVKVYPCEATLTVRATIKGTVSRLPQKVLWFSYFHQCTFDWPKRERHTEEQVWFLKVEGDRLRPIFDNSAFFIGLSKRLAYDDNSQLRITLARALLTPELIARSEEEFVDRFNEFHSLAREIVGNTKCVELLGETQSHASATLKGEICRFLAGQNECSFSQCPPGRFYPGSLGELEKWQTAQVTAILDEISENRMQRVFKSGNANDKQILLERLVSLSCNHDSRVKRRVRDLIERKFPGTTFPNCIACR